VRQDDRAPFERALREARSTAFVAGEFAGQESFMTAGEIRALAARAGIGPGVRVLDLCCGVGGPARLLDCDYLGVDASASAIDLARSGAPESCRFELASVPPVPSGPFDVVLLLETMLAFADKDALVRGVAGALGVGGRFAFTLEAGEPLTASERSAMPDADTVWLTPVEVLVGTLERAGFAVRWQEDVTAAHRATAAALGGAYAARADAIAGAVGARALDDLLAAHRLWVNWLGSGRVRKLALVAERTSR
jgi:SAM-dependent methyltransferase